jgi:uncharacterized protein (TIGR04255 family)
MMLATTHYTRAPITEAILDVRVKLPENIGLTALEEVQRGEEAAYPFKSNRGVATGEFRVGAEVSASAKQKHVGFLFRSADEKQIVQSRLDGFTMSRLAPYESWPPFRNEARRLWEKYRELVAPEAIERLAVRYINRLDLPLPVHDFRDYLCTVPEVSPSLPQGLSGFFMQLSVPVEDIKSLLLLTETMIEPNRPDVASIMLDIDIFRTIDLPSDEEGIWSFFEILHERKNDVFESCITDRLRELIE